MISARHRPIWVAAGVLALVWLLAWGGYRFATGAKMTAEKLSAQIRATDLARLSAERRARALQGLADGLNRLSLEDRRKVRFSRKLDDLLRQMTEAEQAAFIEKTMPTGLKQMLSSFEQLPEDRRHRAITNALERLRRDRDEGLSSAEARDRPPVVSPEVQKRVVAVGLKTFYSESSAKAKAELAPLLEEIQRTMEGGRLFHGPR